MKGYYVKSGSLVIMLVFLYVLSIPVASMAQDTQLSREETIQTEDIYEILPEQEDVDPYEPVLNIGEEVDLDKLSGITLMRDDEIIPVEFDISDSSDSDSDLDNAIKFESELVHDFQKLLEFNKQYELKIYLADGSRYLQPFKTDGLPDIADTGSEQIVYVPSQSDKGFNYPYFLILPPDDFKHEHEDEQRFLFVEPNNTGSASNYYEQTLLSTEAFLGSNYSRELWSPKMMPVFPRHRLGIPDNDEWYYTHSLDRLSLLHTEDRIDELMEKEDFVFEMESGNLEKDDLLELVRVDKQMENMIDHAIEYLNDYDHDVHEQEVFLTGFSASGDFTNRWATLYPERVRAVASGGMNSQIMLPTDEADGEDLIYPIGTADYEELMGEEFDLDAYNDVAKFIYQGALDENDTFGFNDAFGPEETRLIGEVLGEEMYPDRWETTKELFFEAGGKGNFAIYTEEGHSPRAAREDIVNFFKANRDSEEPVYPEPEHPNRVEFNINE